MSHNKNKSRGGRNIREESKSPEPRRRDEWTVMRTIISELFETIEQDQGKVTYGTFLAAIYAYYITNEGEFYTFIKYIEEHININKIKLDSIMEREDLINLCMPCHSRAKIIKAPEPVEVMLFFELIDSDRNGTIRVDELADKLTEVQ